MGLFILASNDISIASEEVLKYYEGQDNLERGFRFLKSDAFSISKVYQKNKARMKQFQIKKGKPKPTMKWIFFNGEM